MEMWGDAKGACSLKRSDSLSASLFEITGPTHIPYNDARWQKLLLHYEQLVHLHNIGLSSPSCEEEDDVVGTACRQCAKHSAASSNLASFCLHVARMIRELQSSLELFSADSKGSNAMPGGNIESSSPRKRTNGGSENVGVGKSSTKQRITLIGKARVTCGAINLLRILTHETIVQACCSGLVNAKVSDSKNNESDQENSNQSTLNDANCILKESFTYRDSRDVDRQSKGRDAAMDIIASTMSFISSFGGLIQQGKEGNILAIAEIYDVQVQIYSLLLVLLSTQLYQPMVSSAELAAQGRSTSHFFMEKWMAYSHWQRTFSYEKQQNREELMRQQQAQSLGQENISEQGCIQNEPLLFLSSCLHWLCHRPAPPRQSIAAHFVEFPKSIVQQMTHISVAADGMYENPSVVMASLPTDECNIASNASPSARAPLTLPNTLQGAAPVTGHSADQTAAIALGTDDTVDLSSPGHISADITTWNSSSDLLSHPIRSILLLSSTFFLLPIRLVRLAFNLLGHGQLRAIMGGSSSYHMKNITDGHQLLLQQLQAHSEKNLGWNRTNNILWLTDSPIADLGSALMLLLSNNCRSTIQNPFRIELASLNDNRWVGGATGSQLSTVNSLFPSPNMGEQMTVLSVNFESLFEAFGRIIHTELGALTLYTLLLSSPTFAESIAARSDLDTLVMPLLRSLYFSTTPTSNIDPKNAPKGRHLPQLITLSAASRPFRSQSQLYVILILLLILSQDPSFGRDSFRRVRVQAKMLKWYKERHIKEVSLGSMVLLVLMRAITFDLNQLQDGFLLSNCCAVLLNLSPHITDLHDYIATRLVSVTTSCFKKYAALVTESGIESSEGDLSSLLGMHGETCRTLLTLMKHSIRRRCLEKNIHLVYAILLEQRDLQYVSNYASLGDMSSILALIRKAAAIIEQNANGLLSADETLGVLKMHMPELKSYHSPEGVASDNDSVASDASDLGNLTFTYEEEADPEVFFVPYVWDMIVGTLTTTMMEWSRNEIQVFPLNEAVIEDIPQGIAEVIDNNEEDAHKNTPDVV